MTWTFGLECETECSSNNSKPFCSGGLYCPYTFLFIVQSTISKPLDQSSPPRFFQPARALIRFFDCYRITHFSAGVLTTSVVGDDWCEGFWSYPTRSLLPISLNREEHCVAQSCAVLMPRVPNSYYLFIFSFCIGWLIRYKIYQLKQ